MQELVQTEVQRWASKGINIKYETRPNRKGYKAGALRQGMMHPYVRTCEHVAMFDADFQPEPDFLMRTIPFLSQNPQLALVQARWKFGNFLTHILSSLLPLDVLLFPIQTISLSLGGSWQFAQSNFRLRGDSISFALVIFFLSHLPLLAHNF